MEVHILAGMLLSIQCYWDIKKQEIPTNISVVGAILGFLLSVHTRRDFLDVCMALLPGVSLCVFGYLSRESIGYGDGILICVLGMFYTWKMVVLICFLSLVFSAAMALVLFVVFGKSGKERIPFVPFLLLGWFIHMWV